MSDTLKDCPFCGLPPAIEYRREGTIAAVGCENPDCPINPGVYDGMLFATLEEWNTRPVEDPLRQQMIALSRTGHGTQTRIREMEKTISELRKDNAEKSAMTDSLLATVSEWQTRWDEAGLNDE